MTTSKIRPLEPGDFVLARGDDGDRFKGKLVIRTFPEGAPAFEGAERWMVEPVGKDVTVGAWACVKDRVRE